MNKDSLLFWWPRIQYLPIPMPRTEIFPVDRDLLLDAIDDPQLLMPFMPEISATASKIGYPLFLRTDQASGKHDWKNSCYVPNEEALRDHILKVIEFNEIADIFGLQYEALVFREFIELDWKFKAFWGEMPVARERRYFIKDSGILCHHPYWIEDAIARASPWIQESNWRELLKDLNTETNGEVKLLTEYSTEVASLLEGYWSIDFAHAKDGRWILIDIATGENSWHPECGMVKKAPSSMEKVAEVEYAE